MNPHMAAQQQQQQRYQQAQRQAQYRGRPMAPGHTDARAQQQQQQAQMQMLAQQRQMQQQQHAALEWKEKQQRSLQRAKRPTDQTLPDGVAEVAVGDGAAQYRRMRDAERRLDAVVVRKMLELQEQDGRVPAVPRRRTMRVWVSNSAEAQPWQGSGLDENAFDFDTGSDARYRVKIVGRLVDEADPEDDGLPAAAPAAAAPAAGSAGEDNPRKGPSPKFSHFFSRVTVDLDRAKSLQPDAANLIDWKRPAAGADGHDVDGLEFERKGDENLQCTIGLYRDEPDLFKLAAPLAALLDMPEGSRDQAVNGLWEYVRIFELPVDESKNVVQCDEALKSIFSSETLLLPRLHEAVQPLLLPLPPIVLPYTIRVDPQFIAPTDESAPSPPTTYAVTLALPSPYPSAAIASLYRTPATLHDLKTLAHIDRRLARTVARLRDSKARHEFFGSMAADPPRFVRRWVSSQQRDLEIIAGDAKHGGEREWAGDEWRRGGATGVWGSLGVRESVGLMVRTKGGY